MPPSWNELLGDLDVTCLHADAGVPLLSILLSKVADSVVGLLSKLHPHNRSQKSKPCWAGSLDYPLPGLAGSGWPCRKPPA